MMRLKSKLLSLNASKTNKVKVYSPRNCEELRIPFKADKMAKVVGKLASIPPPQDLTGDVTNAPLVTGVLVQNDFKLSLMAPEDLREYAGLNTTTITCKQRLTLSAAGIDLIKWALEGTFGTVEELPEMRRQQPNNKNDEVSKNDTSEQVEEEKDQGTASVLDDDDEYIPDAAEEEAKQEKQTQIQKQKQDLKHQPEAADEEVAALVAAYLVMGCVTVRYRTNCEVELEWEANMLNDGIADSVMAVLFSVESSPAAVKRSSAHSHSHSHHHHHDQPTVTNPHAHPSPSDRLDRLFWFLEAQFGADNVAPVEIPRLAELEPETPLKQVNATPAEDAMEVDTDTEGTDPTKEDMLRERQAKELERLHKIGIPVPGVSIKVDKMHATVWLEDLEVDCNNKVFADRVRAVVERGVEVTAPLWG